MLYRIVRPDSVKKLNLGVLSALAVRPTKSLFASINRGAKQSQKVTTSPITRGVSGGWSGEECGWGEGRPSWA